MVKKFIAVTMMLGLSVSAMAATVDGVMLKYMVSESGVEPQLSRILVTPEWVRMDDGEDDGDYLLFNRQQKLISSVTHEDGTVFGIPPRTMKHPPPIALERNKVLEVDDKAPKVDGKQPHKLRLFVNEKLCYDAVVVPGLLDDAVKALRSFSRVLAGEQAKMLLSLPEDMVDGCDLALHTFYPEWSLESGLAIQEWDNSLQRGQLLVDIEQHFKFDSMLLQLPITYKYYSTP